MIEPFHPFLPYLVGALLVPFLPRGPKKALLLLVPALAFWDLLRMPQGTYWQVPFLGYQLVLGQVDKLSLVFAYVFVIMSFAGLLYALHVQDDLQHVAALVYAGSALGVVFAGDLFTLYVFWELMAVASVFLIWAKREPRALAAGFRYLLVHLFGGACLLAGIVLWASQHGSLAFSGPLTGGGWGFWLILLGFTLNAAVPPLHPWLPDAYPEATITGAVFLTAYTTKAAVYTLLRAFPGVEVLAWSGAVMAVYGVVWAIVENDIRRLLAYHIVSQVGYMVCGVGLGSYLSMNGSAAHAFCHILYKALLFMGTGAVIYSTGLRKMTDLQGRDLHWQIPLSLVFYMVGAFSISAVPLFSGFICKPMIVAAAAEGHRAAIFLLLHLASIGTWLCIGLKLPYYTWFGRADRPREAIEVRPLPLNMTLGMAFLAFLCLFLGIFPGVLYKILPYPVHFHPYEAKHVVDTLQMLLATVVGVWLLIGRLKPDEAITLDTDWFYRQGAGAFLRLCFRLASLRTSLQEGVGKVVAAMIQLSKNPLLAAKALMKGDLEGIPAYDPDRYRLPVGVGVMSALLLLSAFCYLLFASLTRMP